MKRWNRRTVLISTVAAASAATTGAGIWLLAGRSRAKGLLRPPGALDEEAFLASCIKCGQCIQVCPYHSLKLLDLAAGIDMGTPAVDARQRGCYLCDLFPCILCCPSGALDAEVREIKQVQMGIAVLHDPQRCWAVDNKPVTEKWLAELKSHGNETDLEQTFNAKLMKSVNKPCRLCEEVCPIPKRETAIAIQNGVPVIGRGCVGCGACVEVCPEGIFEIAARKKFDDVYKNQGGRS